MKKKGYRHKSPGRKKFLIFFVVVIVAITALAVFGDTGIIDVLRLKEERGVLEGKNASLEGENRRLAGEIELLKNDKRYIATIARKELGMVGSDEVIYKTEEE